MLANIGLTVITVLLLFGVYMLLRNNLVYALRMRTLEVVHQYSIEAIDQNRDWECYHAVIDSVSYDAMMRTFWKPLRIYEKELLESLAKIKSSQEAK